MSLPAAAAAKPAATERYVLTLPGVEQADRTEAAPDPKLGPPADAAGTGVTGERVPDPAPLAALGAVLVRPWVLLTLAAILAAVLISSRSGRRRGG